MWYNVHLIGRFRSKYCQVQRMDLVISRVNSAKMYVLHAQLGHLKLGISSATEACKQLDHGKFGQSV